MAKLGHKYGKPYVDFDGIPAASLAKLKEHKLYKLKKYNAESLYKIMEIQGEKRKNLPYDYSETLLSKTLSPYIYRKSDTSIFLTFINDWIVALIRGVGKLKIFKNFTVDRDYKHIK